jgi:hypothetical protein
MKFFLLQILQHKTSVPDYSLGSSQIFVLAIWP